MRVVCNGRVCIMHLFRSIDCKKRDSGMINIFSVKRVVKNNHKCTVVRMWGMLNFFYAL